MQESFIEVRLQFEIVFFPKVYVPTRNSFNPSPGQPRVTTECCLCARFFYLQLWGNCHRVSSELYE